MQTVAPRSKKKNMFFDNMATARDKFQIPEYILKSKLQKKIFAIFTSARSQRSFDVLISREGKKEQRRSEPRREWGKEMVKRTPASRRRSHGRNFCT